MLHLVFALSDTMLFDRFDRNHDVVIFLDKVVLNLLEGSRFEPYIRSLDRCYVLKEELVYRGIASDKLVEGIACISYSEFVDITINHSPVQTWN